MLALSSLACLLAGQAPAGAANLLKDGGFELPSVPAGSLQRFQTNSKIGPWLVTGADGNVDLISTTYAENGYTFNAQSQKQWLDLTGASQSATGVSQAFATVAGVSYTLTFYVGSVYNPGGIFGAASTMTVMNGDKIVLTASMKGKAGTTTQTWKRFTTTIKASGSQTRLTFLNGDPSSDTDCGLDNVSLSEVSGSAMLKGLKGK